MKREIIINASALEVRVALLEDGGLAEFYLKRDQRGGLAGNIYKGRVTRVLPGMQAAFVDIGLEKAGFLHVSDFSDNVERMAAEVIGEEDVQTEPGSDDDEAPVAVEAEQAEAGEFDEGPDETPEETSEEGAPEQGAQRRGRRGHRRRGGGAPSRTRLPIEQQLKRGQEIIVQVAKEPMGTKGARLTSFISIPGRHLVFTPTSNRLGISRRIESREERARLRSAVKEFAPADAGFIVRTACEGVSKREIQRDVAFLTKLWARSSSAREPSARRLCSTTISRSRCAIVRDLFSSDIERLQCDDPDTYNKIVQFVQTYMPRLRSRIALYDADEPIFDRFQIEEQIDRALERKVWLKSGGYLVIDQAEALIRDRRQYRPLRRQAQSGRNGSAHQPRSGRGGRQTTASAQHRRHYHRRFHRYDSRGRPQEGQRGPHAGSNATRRAARCSRSRNSGWSR